MKHTQLIVNDYIYPYCSLLWYPQVRTATETALDLWTELLVTPLQWVPETAVSLRRGWNLNQLYGVHSLAVVRGCDQDWPHSPLVTLATINTTDVWKLYTTYLFLFPPFLFLDYTALCERTFRLFHYTVLIIFDLKTMISLLYDSMSLNLSIMMIHYRY